MLLPLPTKGATVKGDHTTQEIETVLYEELAKLAKEGPTQIEVDRVIKNSEMALVKKLENSDSLADEVAATWAVTGDETTFTANLDRIKEVKPADVQRVAKAYFSPQQRVVATLVRPSTPSVKDPLDAQLETLLGKAIAAEVSDAAQAQTILEQQMVQLRALPAAKKEEILKQLQAQFGGK